ncbi:hypothetical protein J437_LFUL006176 [Ladona fulva]|uniref:Serine/threonine-protein kinase RIO3 n=1 Tax=Ladona fulva TaxID=123851 RepID=A0A8K0JYU0_LADFU|nr:hypothetical protein J437_LFUL006176 [Ladona fulva]
MEKAEPIEIMNPPTSNSPWGKINSTVETVSLGDIMSEQLATDLQSKEDRCCLTDVPDVYPLNLSDDYECDSDAAIARALQLQYDKEYDEILKRTENKFNGNSKVSISYSKYLRTPNNLDFDSDSEPEEEIDDRHRQASEKAFMQIPRCGYRKLGASEVAAAEDDSQQQNSTGKINLVTKHDMTTAGRRNACRVMTAFPPEVCTGDGGGFDMQLSNKVFNSLRAHHQSEAKRRIRVADKSERATCEQCLDPPTRLLLLKLLDGGTLKTIHGILGTGKEAVVVHAIGGPGPDPDEHMNTWGARNISIPDECAIKIFKTTLNRFKAREQYIREDYRFKDRFKKQNPRKVIHLWAEKEMHNLVRMQKAAIPCPQVVILKKHILVMSFIGDGEPNRAAPKLKDAILTPDQYVSAYNQIVDAMIRMYRDAELVHCDLSEYNVLWQSKEQRCVIIDVAQAVETNSHPLAKSFLMRDCENVTSYFIKKGVKEAKSAKELFFEITKKVREDESDKICDAEIAVA